MSYLEQVQTKLQEEVPLIRHIGLQLVSWDGHSVTAQAPLAPNLNTHGTAFGGSLYCVAAMTGWSLVHLSLLAAGYQPSVWVVKGEVAYKTPVRGSIQASATIAEADRQHLLDRYQAKGRTKVDIEVVVMEGEQVAMTMAAQFAAMAQDP